MTTPNQPPTPAKNQPGIPPADLATWRTGHHPDLTPEQEAQENIRLASDMLQWARDHQGQPGDYSAFLLTQAQALIAAALKNLPTPSKKDAES